VDVIAGAFVPPSPMAVPGTGRGGTEEVSEEVSERLAAASRSGLAPIPLPLGDGPGGGRSRGDGGNRGPSMRLASDLPMAPPQLF